MKKTVLAMIIAAFAVSVMLTLGSCSGNAPANDKATTDATTAQQYIGTAANASGENGGNAAQTDKSGKADNADSNQTVAPNQPYVNDNNNGTAANKTTAKAAANKTTAKSNKTAAKTTKSASTTKAASAVTTNKNYTQDVYDPAMPDIF